MLQGRVCYYRRTLSSRCKVEVVYVHTQDRRPNGTEYITYSKVYNNGGMLSAWQRTELRTPWNFTLSEDHKPVVRVCRV